MDPASSSDEGSSSDDDVRLTGEIERGGDDDDGRSMSSSIDNDDSSDAEKVPKSFDDLPSDDSVGVSSSGIESSDSDDGDDDGDVDVSVGDRLRAKRDGLDDQKPVRIDRAGLKRKALSVASERLEALRKKKRCPWANGSNERNDSPSDNEPKTTSSKQSVEHTVSKKRKKSKHKPTEASSRRSDFFARGAPDLNSSGIGVSVGANRYRAHDPRFESLSGHYDQDMFEKKYSFLKDAQEDEIQRLKARVAAWKKTGRSGTKARRKLGLTDGSASLEEDKEQLSYLMQKSSERRKDQVQRAAKRAVKKKIREEVAEGKRGAYYLKRSEQKRLEVEAQFDELQKRGGSSAVDKAIAKKRKKKSSKDKRFLPRKG
uniref:rRNA biogenesis protein RRP36 n=1 Tax=Odontella aurita TaxID=265563 RepID=A0A7S4NJC9_9STRA|mmetsp:Transcript_8998/g.26882  ORF Transcript_8998/g.26882 Transcript_8998/m.26882 type:complete len:372 (+) Transcript_8998:259-1374(+)|eukprot:CAMPEP_0113557328 /NCGR_PEP_ID=MMETSP0015_2-20120614/17732_1 /TAXON_ID=2838 /ORGANISM="Odontella" /LENGTH=371 /DNA_ID=CAMNT_0000458745 /DNA_START=250 /DNA_END=1365 /DNA_ORIENTATION=+ /assembly_acc=CAM_ASM_000160